MHQAVIAACKQCGRNRMMQIDPLTAWDDLLAVENQSLVIAQRGATDSGEAIGRVLGEPAGSLVLCVGPGDASFELSLARDHVCLQFINREKKIFVIWLIGMIWMVSLLQHPGNGMPRWRLLQ